MMGVSACCVNVELVCVCVYVYVCMCTSVHACVHVAVEQCSELVTQWIMQVWVDVCGQEAALVVVPSEINTLTKSFQ